MKTLILRCKALLLAVLELVRCAGMWYIYQEAEVECPPDVPDTGVHRHIRPP